MPSAPWQATHSASYFSFPAVAFAESTVRPESEST